MLSDTDSVVCGGFRWPNSPGKLVKPKWITAIINVIDYNCGCFCKRSKAAAMSSTAAAVQSTTNRILFKIKDESFNKGK